MNRVLLFPLIALLALHVQAEPTSFGLFGDTPYNQWEKDNLPELLAQMDDNRLAFVIHDGDIKSGSSVCSDEAFKEIRDLFNSSATPLVYIPGDNEWTDCHRRSNGAYDPLERLQKVRELFFAGDVSLGRRPMKLERQSRDPAFADYRENVRWEAGGALFVGLNVSGSNNNFHGGKANRGPPAEFIARGAANRAWLDQAFALASSRKLAGIMIVIHANPGFYAANAGKPSEGYRDFLAQLQEKTLAYVGQVVLVHGDTHYHQINHPMENPDTGETVKNFTRLVTIGSPFFGWVKGTVDAADPQVFRFSSRFWNPSPQTN